MEFAANNLDRFFNCANLAYFLMWNSYGFYNDTMYDKEELINVCWETGHWLRYLDKSDYYIAWKMRHDMVQYMRNQLFGRFHKVKKFRLFSLNSIDLNNFVVHCDVRWAELIDEYLAKVSRIESVRLKIIFILKHLGKLTDKEIAKRFNCTHQNISHHLRKMEGCFDS